MFIRLINKKISLMSNELIGTIFLVLGMGLLGSSIEDLYNNSGGINSESIKPILGIILGISASVYGYKRMKVDK